MNNTQLVYHIVSLIPRGKVLTYGQISNLSGINSARAVGQILHRNSDPQNIPCHRAVFAAGGLADNYAFGGSKVQHQKLFNEGVAFNDNKIDLNSCLWSLSVILNLYFVLLRRFGSPGPWPWFSQDKPHTPDEIAIGAILTQNANWLNVQKSIDNLRSARTSQLISIFKLSHQDPDRLKELIKPSGFFNQKSLYLKNFSSAINSYGGLEEFFSSDLDHRKILLNIKGIGRETADTILLYCGNKHHFVVDAYTKQYLDFHKQAYVDKYEEIKQYFEQNLPKNIALYQNYHALIVQWAKNSKNRIQ